ncbi:MAG TPA: hypothetical protein VM536_01430, partial [Chloroflexia bacterium]|nr:hypothetical protein [Chloroflexia bacterium]
GLAWCILRRDWPPVLLAVWFRAHLLWSNPTPQPGSGAQALDTWLWGNPTGLHLPGSGYLDTASVAISAFIPVCLLAAYPLCAAGAGLLQMVRAGWVPAVRGVLATGGLAAAVLGAGSLLPILDIKPYVAPQDLAAMHWMRASIPADALVLGNGFGWPWGPEAVQGSDAGVWAPVLAGRRSTLPPVPAYNERLADPGYLRQAAQIVRSADVIMRSGGSPGAAAAWAYLRSLGITHLYLGSRGGFLDPAVLLAAPDQVHPAYHTDDVWVFALTATSP